MTVLNAFLILKYPAVTLYFPGLTGTRTLNYVLFGSELPGLQTGLPHTYLVDVQGLHGVFDQFDVDLGLLGLQLLVGDELGLCRTEEETERKIQNGLHHWMTSLSSVQVETSRSFAGRDAPGDGLDSAHQRLHQTAAVRHLERLLVLLLPGAFEGRRQGRGRSSDRRRGGGRRKGGGGGRSGRGRHPWQHPRVHHTHLRLRFALLKDGDELVASDGVELQHKHLFQRKAGEPRCFLLLSAIRPGLRTSSILMRMSRPFPFSCSDLERMQSTRFSSSLQDMVWMLLGRDSSSMFLAKSCTASDKSVRGRFWRTWCTRSARVL